MCFIGLFQQHAELSVGSFPQCPRASRRRGERRWRRWTCAWALPWAWTASPTPSRPPSSPGTRTAASFLTLLPWSSWQTARPWGLRLQRWARLGRGCVCHCQAFSSLSTGVFYLVYMGDVYGSFLSWGLFILSTLSWQRHRLLMSLNCSIKIKTHNDFF